MNILLCGDFLHTGYQFCKCFNVPKDKKVNILFCTYSLEYGEEYNNATKLALHRAFNVGKIIPLTPNYDFSDQIDVICINGGKDLNNLIVKLNSVDHVQKIKQLVENGAIYIGISSGAIIAGDYSMPQLFEGEISKENELLRKNFAGFKFIPQVFVPHTSKYRFPYNFDIPFNFPTYRIHNTTSQGINPLYRNLKLIKTIKSLNKTPLSIKENEVFVITPSKQGKLVFNWSHIPVKENIVTKDEEKIKNLIKENN
jgi:peptidase E